MKTIFTIGDVAKLCGVAPRDVSRWFDSGRLRGYRMPGSQDRRIPMEYLRKFLRERDFVDALKALDALQDGLDAAKRGEFSQNPPQIPPTA